jgi:hypothetical protein
MATAIAQVRDHDLDGTVRERKIFDRYLIGNSQANQSQSSGNSSKKVFGFISHLSSHKKLQSDNKALFS